MTKLTFGTLKGFYSITWLAIYFSRLFYSATYGILNLWCTLYRPTCLTWVGGVSKRWSTPCLEKPSEVTRCQTSSSVASTHSLVCAVPEHSGWISPSNNQTESNIPVSKQNCYIGKVYCSIFLSWEHLVSTSKQLNQLQYSEALVPARVPQDLKT